MRRPGLIRGIMPAVLLSGLGLILASTDTLFAQTPTPVFVELKQPAPTAVARYEAALSGQAFDAGLHRASIRLAQDNFLKELTAAGILYSLTSSTLQGAGGTVQVPDRYTELINAVRFEVAGEDVGRVRGNPNVRQITVDEPLYLNLDHSVPYIRANGPDSARSGGLRGTGEVNANGSSTGQVIAVLDTGIDHTNPMFDSRFNDSQFEARSSDARPVRLQGTPYVPGQNHPKVGYRFLFAQAPVEGDDTGHGTNVASTAAGLKARADAILNNGEVVEGVAPGAVLMDYKVCPSLVCLGAQIQLALQDAARETDIMGFPKPRATVVNMSFGDDSTNPNSGGNPNSANAVAAGNLQFLDVLPEASAGNSGPGENTIGSPAAGRLVVATAATTDPGALIWSADVLDPSGVDRSSMGAVVPASGLPAAQGQRSDIKLFRMAGTPNPPPGSMAQYYVFVRNGQTIDEWPASARGRIALVKLASPRLPATTFAQIANNGALAGAVAVLFRSAIENPTAVSAPIPAANLLPADADYLIRILSSTDNDAADPPNGALSEFPVRLNPPGLFLPDTAGFSSRGPNNDFRVIKPDITAPGADILMGASKVGALGSPTGFTSASGTSFSGPHVSGAAALVRDSAGGRPGFSPSQVRAALMNSSTNLRQADGASIPDTDDNNFIHETGSGLTELVRAISVDAVMGTNDLSGSGGPDDPRDPNFLPSHSFGQRPWIGTNLPASDLRQQATMTVTVADVGSAGGLYRLAVVDAGARRGRVTRPLDTPGFSLSLSPDSVSLPSNGPATFDVFVAVDGTSTGLQIAGTDNTGAQATEFLWYVVATPKFGSKSLRMPFSLRVVRGQEGGGPVGDANGGGWIPRADDGRASFNFNAHGSTPPEGHIQFDDPQQGVSLKGNVTSVSVSADGTKATFGGTCTLADGSTCEYTVNVEDNAEPGKGADRFTIDVAPSNGPSFQVSGLLGGGNIQVRIE